MVKQHKHDVYERHDWMEEWIADWYFKTSLEVGEVGEQKENNVLSN